MAKIQNVVNIKLYYNSSIHKENKSIKRLFYKFSNEGPPMTSNEVLGFKDTHIQIFAKMMLSYLFNAQQNQKEKSNFSNYSSFSDLI